MLENLQHKVVVVGGRKSKMLFVDPLLEQALVWSRQAMSLKETKLSETFGTRKATRAAFALGCMLRAALDVHAPIYKAAVLMRRSAACVRSKIRQER